MRHILILTISIFTSTLQAQELPNFLASKINYCDENLSDKQADELRKELNDLEDYFVRKGLLADRSGASYRNVYNRIAKEGDLLFEIDTTFNLLKSLEFIIYSKCSFKVLTDEQLSKVTFKYQEVAEHIMAPYEGEVTLEMLAQRIVNNLTEEDFELELFKVSALVSFYKISTSKSILDFPDFSNPTKHDITTIEVFLTNENKIQFNEKYYTIEKAKIKILEFLESEPMNRGIELTASRGALYESYLELTCMFNDIYDELRLKHPDLPKNIFFNEPK